MASTARDLAKTKSEYHLLVTLVGVWMLLDPDGTHNEQWYTDAINKALTEYRELPD